MSKTLLVAHREYMENVKTKGFWFSTLIMPLIFGASMVVPYWFEANKDAKTYVVEDQSGWLSEAVEARIEVEDLKQLFSQAALLSEIKITVFPEHVRALVPHFKDADKATLEALVKALIDGRSADLSGEAQAALAQHGDALMSWWRELTPKQAGRLVPGLAGRRYNRLEIEPGTTQEKLNEMVRDERIFAYFIIGPDPVKAAAGCRYGSANLTDANLQEWYTGLANSEVRRKRLEEEDIEPALADWISKGLTFEQRFISEAGDEEADEGDAVQQWAPVAFVYLLWLSVFMVAMMMLTSTVMEKTNRLVEVLLSSVSAVQLMAGKILGIAATGLTTVGLWLISFMALVHFLPRMLGIEMDYSLSSIASDPHYLVSFVVYFTLGYLFYGAVLVGLGSVCDNLKDAQNLASPVTLLLFVPMMLMVPIGQDPNGTLARLFSYFPPMTPFVMMNRAAGPPSTTEYVLTTLLMIVSVAFALWAAAKIFRVGILMSGKPPKISEIIRMIRM